jgi:glutamate/tyrosine decarboxylase-like PLP-dependent enzyme
MSAPDLPAFDPASFRRTAGRVVDLVVEHLAGVRERPVFRPMRPEQRLGLLDQPLPDQGLTADRIVELFGQRILPHPMGNGHPRFFAWVNSPPEPVGVLAEFLAAAMNPSCAGGDHAAIYLERCCTRWLMEVVDFPFEGSMGLLVSGCSMATLTCLAAARHRVAVRDGWNVREEGLQGGRPPLMLYLSEEGHSCIRKAAEMLGIGAAGCRVVGVNDRFEMDVRALREAVRADRTAGRRPFCVAASAGTVNTGAIDPLGELADFCREEDLWLHVDGAYGAVGVLDPQLTPRYAGMSRADSLALDPHKWLSVPVECGCALIRDAANLRDTFSLVPPG